MKRFVLSNEAGQHLGFMVFLAESMDDEELAQSGVCMLRLNEEAIDLTKDLPNLAEQALFWQYDGQGLQLRDETGVVVGQVREQYARLGRDRLLLADLNESE